MRSELFEGCDLKGVGGESMPQVQALIRHENNGWTFHLRIAGYALLPDGRKVRVDRTIPVRATEQVGRRPSRPRRPAA